MRGVVLILVLLPLSVCMVRAQTFITKGKIEFEKKLNVKKMMNDQNKGGAIDLPPGMPAYATCYFNLYFDSATTLYRPGRTMDNNPYGVLDQGKDNVVYSDLAGERTVAQKNLFDATFLLTGNLRRYKWKMEPDTRTIAGFKCHKATTIVFDSVYVIAFYSEEIMTSGGPESFQGLPGMILGISIPRMNTTWIATKLELAPVGAGELAPPVKGKPIGAEELSKKMKDKMGGVWGMDTYFWQMML